MLLPVAVPTTISIYSTGQYSSCKLLFRRNMLTLLICPSYFFSAFLWEMAALYATHIFNLTSYDFQYFLLTGSAAAFGIFFARYSAVVFMDLNHDSYMFEVHSTIQSSLSSGIAAGSLWQYSVNLSIKYDFSFTEAFFFVFTLSTVCYFITTIAIRLINTKLPVDFQLIFRPLSPIVIYYDFLESLTVGIADAFFVGTNSKQFGGSWLYYFAVIPSKTPFMMAMFLAGSSASVGFLLLQVLLNIVLTQNWIDQLFVTTPKPLKANVS